MDGQLSFATLDYVGKKKRTKRDVFLAEMAAAVTWSVLEAVITRALSEGGSSRRPSSVSDRRDVAHLLPAAVVQSV
jgi:hypothetical protein